MSGYVKAPPDKLYIISGFRKPRSFTGRAAIRVPFLERLDKLDLATMQIDVKTSSAVPTNDYINIKVDSVVNVKIPTVDVEISQGEQSPTKIYSANEMQEKARQNFLNRNKDYIITQAREVLEGNVREIIGQMKLESMVQDRQQFADLVRKNASPDLAQLGLAIISFNVQNFIDDNGVIANLGIDNVETIRKKAEIAKAQAKKDIAVAQSEADKTANDAKVKAELEIAQKNNDLEIKKADLRKISDTQKAIADAAFNIQAQEQEKILVVKTAEAVQAKQEKDIELTAQLATIEERKLEASVKKQADAEKYAAEQQAEAAKITTERAAEAAKFRREQDAEADLSGAKKQAEALEAKARANLVVAENEAKGIQLKGEAEAKSIEAQGLAKAKALDAEAEAMKKMEQAAVIKTIVEALPLIAKEVAAPLSNVDTITMYGEGNAAKLVGDITKTVAQITSGLTDSVGVDLKSLIGDVVNKKS